MTTLTCWWLSIRFDEYLVLCGYSKDLEFEVEDRVFLKLSPWKGVVRFGKRGTLNPRYIGPFEIVERIGPVAYRLDLPEEFSRVHNVFHISMLRKYIPTLTCVRGFTTELLNSSPVFPSTLDVGKRPTA